jgi:hypothetical protein
VLVFEAGTGRYNQGEEADPAGELCQSDADTLTTSIKGNLVAHTT